ncbi:methionyl-tRNA formyltransferase [Mycoplasmopsis sturni]|uniref:methionyl-tRNA formyltransferase n=1 Tax=Mycoplasmopsis sturni TaxID=39047 RepID=UPI00056D98C6
MKVILAGTPAFSVPAFEKVIQNFEVVAIISQPDRPANRGYKLDPTPVKLLAEKYNIKVFQPEKIGQIYEELLEYDFDIFLSCAFGQYVPTKILILPKKAALNIHGSLLPKYRGAAPIQHALLNGDVQTGLNLIYMVDQMDAGDVLAEAKIDILPSDTSDTLFTKLSQLAADSIVSWLNDFANDKLTATKQDEQLVTLASKLKKEDALLSYDLTLEAAFNKIRAFSSNPGAYLFINDKRVKIFYAQKQPLKNALKLDFANGSLYAIDYQFESKKRIKLS